MFSLWACLYCSRQCNPGSNDENAFTAIYYTTEDLVSTPNFLSSLATSDDKGTNDERRCRKDRSPTSEQGCIPGGRTDGINSEVRWEDNSHATTGSPGKQGTHSRSSTETSQVTGSPKWTGIAFWYVRLLDFLEL